MQRLTISADDELTAAFDELIRRRGYTNRSEAFRDLVRKELAAAAEDEAPEQGSCVAIVSYTFDHEARQLSQRLANHQHNYAPLVISTMHVHVDASQCAEAVVLRGRRGEVRHLAENLIAETGIEHGAVNLIPLSDVVHEHHHHEHDATTYLADESSRAKPCKECAS